MSDEELIRRGDALAAVAKLYKWSIAAGEELEAAIAALPAVTVVIELGQVAKQLRDMTPLDNINR
jgi:hypothetical protein